MPFDSAGHLGNALAVEVPLATARVRVAKAHKSWLIGTQLVDQARLVGTSSLRSERRFFRPTTFECSTRDSLVEHISSNQANEAWFHMRKAYAIHARLGSYGFLVRPWRDLDSFYWFSSIEVKGEHFLVKGNSPLPETNTCNWLLVSEENFTGVKIKPELMKLWDISFLSCLMDFVKDGIRGSGKGGC